MKRIVKLSLFAVLISLLCFNASSQYVIKKATIKKVSAEEYKKIIERQKSKKLNKNRPFVYKFV